MPRSTGLHGGLPRSKAPQPHQMDPFR